MTLYIHTSPETVKALPRIIDALGDIIAKGELPTFKVAGEEYPTRCLCGAVSRIGDRVKWDYMMEIMDERFAFGEFGRRRHPAMPGHVWDGAFVTERGELPIRLEFARALRHYLRAVLKRLQKEGKA